MSTSDIALCTNDELFAELRRRGLFPRCTCGHWETYVGGYDHDGYTWRCRGCLRSIRRCMCA